MKYKKAFVGIVLFLLTFSVGSILVWSPKNDLVSNETARQTTQEIPVQIRPEEIKELEKFEPIPYETAKKFGGAEILKENYWEKEIKYKFELIETGEFHGDEVTAKSGEKWLGFFGKNDDFKLVLTNINVSRVRDEIVDGRNSKKKTGKKVSVKNQSEPLFLLKNAARLKEGKVETFFKGRTFREESEESSTTLDSKFVGNYQIGGKSYVLRVERVLNEQEQMVYALILESENIKQILHVSFEDCLGTLFWVGDLDNDNKPDLFLSPWIKENISESSLFISSEADRNNLVKKVASLGTVGC